MNKMTKIIVMLGIITSVAYSQTFQLGLRAEPTWYNSTLSETRSTPYFHFLITAGLNEENIPLLNDLTEEIRFGRTFTPDYMVGNDLALVLKSHVINNPFYITLGLNLHSNIGSNGPMQAVYVKGIYLLIFGVGFNLAKHIFVEISKYIPISNPAMGESDYYTIDNRFIREQWELNSLIALNFGFTVDIFHF